MKERYWEDFKVGEKFISPGVTLTQGGIIDFALRYDPQPFHLDANAAAESPYGGLIASGFHTLALCFRMFISQGVFGACSMGSPGIDELRWLAPVRPGDTLKTETEVLEARPSSSKPDRGTLRMHYSAINQKRDKVLTMIVIHILKRRAPSK
ncbi:MAG: MaoC family dehydratase [Candidatus Methylomirabilales bacterium]